MEIYWFADEDGHLWQIFAALNESRAWELFHAATLKTEKFAEEKTTLPQLQERFQIAAVTKMTGEGEIATIFPLECNFTIRAAPDSEDLGHRGSF